MSEAEGGANEPLAFLNGWGGGVVGVGDKRWRLRTACPDRNDLKDI